MALIPERVVAQLRAAAPGATVVEGPEALEAYRRDEARQVVAGHPAAAVLPRTTADVVAVLTCAARLGVPVVPRGAGTGLSGGAAAVDGCIVLCTTRMNGILELNEADQYAVVEPGVVTADLDAAAAEIGLWYPPDPSSWRSCTIGGNIATDAGGLCCVRYGSTSTYVLGLEVVLPDGDVLVTGRRTPKSVAGYDLTRLLTGSEGTLGVITQARLRLRPRRPPPATTVAVFPTLTGAGAAILAVLRAGLTTSLLEVMDRTTIGAVEEVSAMGLDTSAAALIVVQTEVHEDAAHVVTACREAGAQEVYASAEPAESDLLLDARRLALPALQRKGAVLLDDVAVPRSALPALLARVEETSRRTGLVIGTFGHAGDGNLHPTIVYDAGDAAQWDPAQVAFDDIVTAALELGGTVTGEHGVGRLKPQWLAREAGAVSLRIQRAIKEAVDPHGLMNPGAVLPPASV